MPKSLLRSGVHQLEVNLRQTGLKLRALAGEGEGGCHRRGPDRQGGAGPVGRLLWRPESGALEPLPPAPETLTGKERDALKLKRLDELAAVVFVPGVHNWEDEWRNLLEMIKADANIGLAL